MATTTGTQFERHEAADGRFLNVLEQRTYSTASTEIIDISGLSAMRQEALSYVDFIKTTPSTPGFLLEGLSKVLAEIESGLQINHGALKIDDLCKDTCARLGSTGLGEYQQVEELGRSFVVPADKITAARVLLFEEMSRHFNPRVDLRIKSHQDKPVTIFDGPGKVVEQESIGRWYRFPLQETVIVALVSRRPQ